MSRKHWSRSKTIWINALVLLFATLELQLGALKEYLPPHWYAWLLIGLPSINLILRMYTRTRLTRQREDSL